MMVKVKWHIFYELAYLLYLLALVFFFVSLLIALLIFAFVSKQCTWVPVYLYVLDYLLSVISNFDFDFILFCVAIVCFTQFDIICFTIFLSTVFCFNLLFERKRSLVLPVTGFASDLMFFSFFRPFHFKKRSPLSTQRNQSLSLHKGLKIFHSC